MKTYAVFGHKTLDAGLEFMKTYELSQCDSSDYTIDEIDGITFFSGPRIEEEMKKVGAVCGCCYPTGDIAISMSDCQTISGLTGLPLEKVVKLVLHHEDYHRVYDFGGGLSMREFLDSDIEEFELGVESEINADLNSIKFNCLSVEEYFSFRDALRTLISRVGPIDLKYLGLEDKVLEKLEEKK